MLPSTLPPKKQNSSSQPLKDTLVKSLFSFQSFLLIAILAVSLISLNELYNVKLVALQNFQEESMSNTMMMMTNNQDFPKQKPSPKQVFIDLGANEGDSLQSFVGDVGSMGGSGIKGRGKNGKWTIWAFEAHPHFTEKLKKVQQEIEAKQYNGEKQYEVHMMTETPITTKNGPVKFYLDTVSQAKWGSSLFETHRDVVGQKKFIMLDGVSLSDLILKNYSKDDYIVLKMDVEGIEFDLLIDLMKTGALQYVDELFCEYHDFLSPLPNMPNVLRYIIEKQGIKQGNWS